MNIDDLFKNINFYCDESSHLMNDSSRYMSLAACYCSKIRLKTIKNQILSIRKKYNFSVNSELKWNKVSNSNINMYKEIIKYIAYEPILKVRIIIADKNGLNKNTASIPSEYNLWYQKMYYFLLRYPLNKIANYQNICIYPKNVNLYIDKKDSNSFIELSKTAECLSYTLHNMSNLKVYPSDSKDYILIQIADVLAGAATYHYRENTTSPSKRELCDYIQKELGINFESNTSYNQENSNVFIWNGILA